MDRRGALKDEGKGVNLSTVHTRTFRDRHGRNLRGPLLPPQVPRYRSSSESFDMATLEAYAPIQRRFSTELSGLDIAVDIIPRMRLRPDDALYSDNIVADGPVPLARLIPAGTDDEGRATRARIVLFRMPIDTRCISAIERLELLRSILTQLVATHLNLTPRDIDPRWQ